MGFRPFRTDLDPWLVQEIADPVVTKDLQRQIEVTSIDVDREYGAISKLVVIILVYKSMSLDEKGSLLRQLEAVKANSSLSHKLSFQVWDKDDL